MAKTSNTSTSFTSLLSFSFLPNFFAFRQKSQAEQTLLQQIKELDEKIAFDLGQMHRMRNPRLDVLKVHGEFLNLKNEVDEKLKTHYDSMTLNNKEKQHLFRLLDKKGHTTSDKQSIKPLLIHSGIALANVNQMYETLHDLHKSSNHLKEFFQEQRSGLIKGEKLIASIDESYKRKLQRREKLISKLQQLRQTQKTTSENEATNAFELKPM